MRVLYLTPYASKAFLAANGDLNASGLAGSLKIELISRALANAGHDVIILSSVMTSRSEWKWRAPSTELVKTRNGSVKTIYPRALKLRPWGGALSCLRARSILRKLTSSWRPDAAIIYNSYLFETIAARWLVKNYKVPLWFEVEDLPLARKREYLNIKPMLDSSCWKWVVENSTVYSAVNSSILDLLPADRRRELLPGVVSQKLIENAGRRAPPFRGSVPRTVGYFGGLSRGKGVAVLLEAATRLPREWKLVVAGAGDLADSFSRLARRSPDLIEFAGRLSPEESAVRMCQCDALVLPREHITWSGKSVYPFKTFEYIASGAHIISAPLPQIAGCDTNFFQRWDGVTVSDLIQKLVTAPADFAKESLVRDELKTRVLDLCSEPAVARLATDMISQLAN